MEESTVEGEVEEPEQQVEPAPKERKPKKGRWELYSVKDGALESKSPFCPRCGVGHFMADHGDRYTCGKCYYTEFKNVQQQTPQP